MVSAAPPSQGAPSEHAPAAKGVSARAERRHSGKRDRAEDAPIPVPVQPRETPSKSSSNGAPIIE
jgi:hypothetical protein